MKKLIALAAALALGACSTFTLDGRVDETEGAALAQVRSVAVAQVIAFNQAGIDPLNLLPHHRLYAAAGCTALTAGTVLITQDQRTSNEVAAWCAVFQKAAE